MAMKDSRRKQMENLIAQKQSMTMDELCRAFGMSMNTVRADVAYLVQTGAVEKVYGGVRAVRHQEVPLFAHRATLRTEAKKNISKQAALRVADRDTIYIDAGTTTMHLIDYLEPGKHVTVITGSLYVIRQACDKPDVELIILPGCMNRRTNSVADVSTLEFLGRYHFAKAFMGVSGISPDGKLNVSTYIEYELKKLALQQCQEAFLLADAGKFGGAGLMSYGNLEQMTEVVMDAACPEALRGFCQSAGTKLTIVP